MRNFYQVLGIGESANGEEVKSAYRRLALRYHPDVSSLPGDSDFVHLLEAYETLSDHARRRAYDASLASARKASRPRAMDRRWFADEVAIDFPSVTSVVGRMFDAFRDDERPVPLTAELLLSPSEAFYGTTVPIDVPLRHTCRVCGGRGEVWDDCCGACGGRGELISPYRVNVSVPARIAHGSRFNFSCYAQSTPPTRIEVRVTIQRGTGNAECGTGNAERGTENSEPEA